MDASCEHDDCAPARWPDRSARSPRAHAIGSVLSIGWLTIPVANLLNANLPWWRVAAALLGLVAFSVLYVVAMSPSWLPRLRVGPTLVAMTAIASALAFADRASWTLLFVLTAAAVGLRMPGRRGEWTIVGLTLLAAGASLLAAGGEDQFVALTATTLAIGFMMLSFGRLVRSNGELLSARAAVARLAVAEERERFARDLHDLLGHSLSVIALKTELAGRLLPDQPDAAATHVHEVEDVARAALAEVREAVSGYRRPTLDDELAGARMALEAAGIETRVQTTSATLPPEVEAVLAWAVREGTTNVIRHSGARTCAIVVTGPPAPDGVGASAEIADDGRGPSHALDGGHGLAGLRERAAELRGRVEAGAHAGGGFRLRVTVPVGSEAASA